MLGIDIDDSIILQEPYRLVIAFIVLCAFYMLNYLLDLVWCEWQYKNGGEDFIKYGKKYVKLRSSGNQGIKK